MKATIRRTASRTFTDPRQGELRRARITCEIRRRLPVRSRTLFATSNRAAVSVPSPFGQITFNALGDLLLGLPLVTGGARVDNPQQICDRKLQLFRQRQLPRHAATDAHRRVALRIQLAAVDAEDRANIYDPATGRLVQVGTNGVPRSGYRTPTRTTSRRASGWPGPLAKRATVVRGGYGVYYDQSPLAPGEALYFNAPFFDFNFFFSLPGLPLTIFNPFPFLTRANCRSRPSRFSATSARVHAALESEACSDSSATKSWPRSLTSDRKARSCSPRATSISRRPALARLPMSCVLIHFRRDHPTGIAREFQLQRFRRACSSGWRSVSRCSALTPMVQVD